MHNPHHEHIRVETSSQGQQDNYERARNIEMVLRNTVLTKNPDISYDELKKGIESTLLMGGITNVTKLDVKRWGDGNPNEHVSVSGTIPGKDGVPVSFYHEFN